MNLAKSGGAALLSAALLGMWGCSSDTRQSVGSGASPLVRPAAMSDTVQAAAEPSVQAEGVAGPKAPRQHRLRKGKRTDHPLPAAAGRLPIREMNCLRSAQRTAGGGS
ncbi:hypothetical protein N6H14_16175 [Paenibacillus sp. CC-CFT747]|nr:hypothetical protein N6H14_16175 [Paenibacillus sp. CC-CFT747]